MNNGLPIAINLPKGYLKEEVRCGYTVSARMKAVWAVELDLYNELKRVCEKYGLDLYADGGTILGAVRHQGFIPWDDDMDFMMPRSDYEKLCTVSEEFRYPYFWQTEETNHGTSRGHGQLRNTLTTGIVKCEMPYGENANHGIFIDIFPYDNVPDDEAERKAFLMRIKKLNELKRKYRDYYYGLNFSSGLLKVFKEPFVRLFVFFHKTYRNTYYYQLEKEKLKYGDRDTLLWANLFTVPSDDMNRHVKKREWYRESINMQFEMMSVRIPAMYNDWLVHVYGDWMKYVKGTALHGNILFDPYKSYVEYIGCDINLEHPFCGDGELY